MEGVKANQGHVGKDGGLRDMPQNGSPKPLCVQWTAGVLTPPQPSFCPLWLKIVAEGDNSHTLLHSACF